jgi:hypothetical protein
VRVHVIPRAALVNPPSPGELQLGNHYLVRMPYDLQVLTTYKGELASVDDLPSHPNHIGDFYMVGQTPWVWLFAPGATSEAAPQTSEV